MSDQKQTKENETMNAAQVLVRCLENEGVEYVFGIPGEENLEVMRALKDSKIKFITVRHEQGAAAGRRRQHEEHGQPHGVGPQPHARPSVCSSNPA